MEPVLPMMLLWSRVCAFVLALSFHQGFGQQQTESVSELLLHSLQERSVDYSSGSSAYGQVHRVQVITVGDSITVANTSLIPGLEGMTFTFPFKHGSYPVELQACLQHHGIAVDLIENYAYGGAGAMQAVHMPETLTHPGCSSYWDNEIKERARAAICKAIGNLSPDSALIVTSMFGTNDGKETSLREDVSIFVWDYQLLLQTLLGLDDCANLLAGNNSGEDNSRIFLFLLKPPSVCKTPTEEDPSIQTIHDVIRPAVDQVAFHIRAAINERALGHRIHVVELDAQEFIRGDDGALGAFWLADNEASTPQGPSSLSCPLPLHHHLDVEDGSGGDGVHLNVHGSKRFGLGLCHAVVTHL